LWLLGGFVYWLPAGGGVGFLLPAAVCVCCIRGVLGAVVVFVAAGRGGNRKGRKERQYKINIPTQIISPPSKGGI